MRIAFAVSVLALILSACSLTERNPETGKSPVSEGITVVARKVQEDPSPYGVLEAVIAGMAALGAGYVAKKKYDQRRAAAASKAPTGAATLPNTDAP